MTFSTSTNLVAWNGGVCFKCGSRYIGSHSCTWEDFQRRIDELRAQQEALFPRGRAETPVPQVRDMSHCPCRPENGGSGVCGCVLGGLRTTC